MEESNEELERKVQEFFDEDRVVLINYK